MSRPKQVTRTKTKPISKDHETVQTPLEQAIISSLVIALLFGALAYVCQWSVNVPILAFAVSLCAAWFARLSLFDKLLFVAEQVTRVDLNQDGQVGDKPSHLIVKDSAKAKSSIARQVQQSANGDRLQELQDFIARCYSIGTSESAMGIKPSNRSSYLENRDALFRLGLAGWKSSNPRAGWKLTVDKDAALAVVREHVTHT